jgi:uncharacterized protein YndB with AHSA1/START domain
MANTLKVVVQGDREILMTRTFDAPRTMVFEAMTTPELVTQWLLGPPGWSMVVCEIDLKVGGGFRYVWNGPDRAEMGMHGTFREIVRPEKIVQTEVFDFGCDARPQEMAGEAVNTATLTEEAGRTTLNFRVLSPSKEVRDAVIKSGMEKGVAASYDRLENLVLSKKQQDVARAPIA